MYCIDIIGKAWVSGFVCLMCSVMWGDSRFANANLKDKLFYYYYCLFSRLRRIVTCIWPNQKNQPNLDLHLVRRYKICHLAIVVSYLCIGQNQKNQPNLVLYRVQRSKIFVSVTTLPILTAKNCLIWSRRHQRGSSHNPICNMNGPCGSAVKYLVFFMNLVVFVSL